MSDWKQWAHVIASPRRSGKTTALAKAAKECDGVMVCRDQQEADRIAKEFGIRTVSALGSPDRLRGQLAARLVDPDAFLLWMAQAEQELRQAMERIRELESERP
jgi:trehalose-6-phosphatase